MLEPPSTKPYLLRAIYEWCTDAGFTPYVAVAVDETVRVPLEFVKNGEIVLNVSALATNRLKIGNDAIEFQARFGGVPRDVYVPIARVIAIYARENGQGMAFDVPRPHLPAGVQPAELTDAGHPAAAPLPVMPLPAPAGDETRPPTPGTPRPGERPKLTRVK
ncbi:MAG TPA: ClpXP protease specificity-enhancing factor [Burkholderiaceae bacterium]|jgi:stringent starvation protein B|nr:ClpXP protease specificity-enhancing factor [Burkholderiaceae bacterium]